MPSLRRKTPSELSHQVHAGLCGVVRCTDPYQVYTIMIGNSSRKLPSRTLDPACHRLERVWNSSYVLIHIKWMLCPWWPIHMLRILDNNIINRFYMRISVVSKGLR